MEKTDLRSTIALPSPARPRQQAINVDDIHALDLPRGA